jgi:hypothetical protein
MKKMIIFLLVISSLNGMEQPESTKGEKSLFQPKSLKELNLAVIARRIIELIEANKQQEAQMLFLSLNIDLQELLIKQIFDSLLPLGKSRETHATLNKIGNFFLKLAENLPSVQQAEIAQLLITHNPIYLEELLELLDTPGAFEDTVIKEQIFTQFQKILDKFPLIVQINLLNIVLTTLKHVAIWLDAEHRIPDPEEQVLPEKNGLILELLEKFLLEKPTSQKQIVELLLKHENAFSSNPLIVLYASAIVVAEKAKSHEKRDYFNRILETLMANSDRTTVYQALYYLLFELATADPDVDLGLLAESLRTTETILDKVNDISVITDLLQLLQQWFIQDSLELRIDGEPVTVALNNETISYAIRTLQKYR